jgi:hypothetical protein
LFDPVNQLFDGFGLFFFHPDEEIPAPQMNGQQVFAMIVGQFDAFDVEHVHARAAVFEEKHSSTPSSKWITVGGVPESAMSIP